MAIDPCPRPCAMSAPLPTPAPTASRSGPCPRRPPWKGPPPLAADASSVLLRQDGGAPESDRSTPAREPGRSAGCRPPSSPRPRSDSAASCAAASRRSSVAAPPTSDAVHVEAQQRCRAATQAMKSDCQLLRRSCPGDWCGLQAGVASGLPPARTSSTTRTFRKKTRCAFLSEARPRRSATS